MSDDTKDLKDLENERVHVTVEPKEDSDGAKRHAQKIKENLKGKIRKAIEKKKGEGARKQLDAAEDEVDNVKRTVSPRVVKKIGVKIEGEVDGDQVTREKTVTPSEGGE